MKELCLGSRNLCWVRYKHGCEGQLWWEKIAIKYSEFHLMQGLYSKDGAETPDSQNYPYRMYAMSAYTCTVILFPIT